MLEDIKKIQGINHNEFDAMIQIWINAAKLDLKSIGIVDTLVDTPDDLVKTAIITYALSQLDVVHAELYSNSYYYQKDVLRHLGGYNGASTTPTIPIESA